MKAEGEESATDAERKRMGMPYCKNIQKIGQNMGGMW